ncbi:MAG: hypothetical protein A2Y60_00195 [Chloroflexi bacterium RBG_13_54_9]|nr:MAG: hypothetical protein A2Y60_00195 [Chloroflexi bacterium RBG_13_54_9]
MSQISSSGTSRLVEVEGEALLDRIIGFLVRAAHGFALALVTWVALNAIGYYDRGWMYLLLGLIIVLGCYSMGLGNLIAAAVVGVALLYVSPGVAVWYVFFLLFIAWIYAERQQMGVLMVMTPALFHWSLGFVAPLLQGGLFRARGGLMNGIGVFMCIAVGSLIGSAVYGGFVATGYEASQASGSAPLSAMVKPAEMDALKERIHGQLTSLLGGAQAIAASEEEIRDVIKSRLGAILDLEETEGRLDSGQRPIIERRIIREMKLDSSPLITIQTALPTERFPHLEWIVDLRPADIAEGAARVFRTVFQSIISSPLPLVQFLLWAVAVIVVAQGMGLLREIMARMSFSSLIRDLLSSAVGLLLGLLILWLGYVWMIDSIFGFEKADPGSLGANWWRSLVVALVVIWVVFIYERVPSIGRFMAEIAETGRRWWQRRTVVEEED